MNIILIIIIVIIFSALSYIMGVSIGIKSNIKSKNTVFDVKQNYLEPFIEFLDREYSYEMHQRFSKIVNIVDATNGTTPAIQKLGDMNELRLMISGITTNITTKMSKEIKNAFFRIYIEDEAVLVDYITRWIFFKVRSLITKLTIEIQKNSEIQDQKHRLSNSDIVDKLVLELELNAYDKFGIEKMNLEEKQ